MFRHKLNLEAPLEYNQEEPVPLCRVLSIRGGRIDPKHQEAIETADRRHIRLKAIVLRKNQVLSYDGEQENHRHGEGNIGLGNSSSEEQHVAWKKMDDT